MGMGGFREKVAFFKLEFKEYVLSSQDEAEEGHLWPRERQIQRTEAGHSPILSQQDGCCTLAGRGKTPLGDQVSHAAGCAPSLTPAAIPWQQLPTIMITNGMLPTFPNIPRSEAVLLLGSEKPMNTRKQGWGWNGAWGVGRMGAEDGSRRGPE